MKAATSALVALLLAASIGAGLLLARDGDEDSDDDAGASSTPYHLTGAEPGAAGPANQPLPAPQDPASADRMISAGGAMVAAAEGMELAVAALVASGDPALVVLGQHWRSDARALRARGAWMTTSSTSDSMVHDPSRVHELNLTNLRAGGIVMAEEGRALAGHGRAMAAQVAWLRQGGTISPAVADDLNARAAAVMAAGETLARDGERMQNDADTLLRSLGR